MLREALGVPKVDACEEITLLGHRQLAEDLFYVDVRHLGLIHSRFRNSSSEK